MNGTQPAVSHGLAWGFSTVMDWSLRSAFGDAPPLIREAAPFVIEPPLSIREAPSFSRQA